MAGASGDHTLLVVALVLVTCGMVLTQGTCCAGHSLTDADVKTDLATGSCVRMSSQYKSSRDRGFTFPGSRAVDGVYTPPPSRDSRAPDYTSVAHTQKEDNPWIQIDLGTNRCVKGVKIWNRNVNGGSILSRFRNPLILVSDTNTTAVPGPALICLYTEGAQSAVKFHQCAGVLCGRYVTVMAFQSFNFLNLWEIEVHGW